MAFTESANIGARGKIDVKIDEIAISSCFDSGNLDRVERCQAQFEYNMWTAPDCAGTSHENGNRTWFNFSVKVPQGSSNKTMRFHIQNMNKQSRLYQQRMVPIVRSFPGKGNWGRLRHSVSWQVGEEGLILNFEYAITNSHAHKVYFAFCYPFSYSDCQKMLCDLDQKYGLRNKLIYYYRELLCHSLDGRRIDLLTISSLKGITENREPRLPCLFPDTGTPRAHSFTGKKVFFVSSRVHPGETPASHVFNGLLYFLLLEDDKRAEAVRDNFVVKMIPMLNPDGVARGHYRTDTRGVNLNRVYLTPDPKLHPSIFAAKSVMLHHHQSLKETRVGGVAMYIDLHAHATKRGCFFYGNFLEDEQQQVENILYPRLVALNSSHLDFEHCLFSERNMYTYDKQGGTSKEGSGRVALYKATGIVHCYTLECNYNSGRQTNAVSAATCDGGRASPALPFSPLPHRYNVASFQQVGRALTIALLDLYNLNPWSRLPTSEPGSLAALRNSIALRIKASRSKARKEGLSCSTRVSSSQCSLPPVHGCDTTTRSDLRFNEDITKKAAGILWTRHLKQPQKCQLKVSHDGQRSSKIVHKSVVFSPSESMKGTNYLQDFRKQRKPTSTKISTILKE